MTVGSAQRIIPGVNIVYQDEALLVVDIVNASQLLVEANDGQRKVVEASSVSPASLHAQLNSPDLTKIDDKRWIEALEIYEHLRPLVDLGRRRRTRADVQKVADKIGIHLSTVYRWLDDYEQSGLVSSLLRKPRSDKGHKRILPEVEAIIQQTIKEFHLTLQRRSPAKTAAEAEKRCKQAGLPAPDKKTVRNRISAICGETLTRMREGAKVAAERYQPIRGSFPGADYPLAVVQIDHTPMDVIVVDDNYRKPIDRPYLTTAIDVYSRMVVGFYISLDPPSALSTGLCLSQAILGKEIFLNKLGIDGLTWPCWGIMAKIHADNAKEFRGTMLGRAAAQYGIIREHRPKGRPNFGGHVERAFRTYMTEIHNELPGTTFSNVKHKREYDAEGHAVMTLDALDHWFTVFILGVYHQRPHSGIDNIPPIVKWDQGICGTESAPGTGVPTRVRDEERLRLDFMPYFERTVQEYGVMNEGLTYWSDALRHLIHKLDSKDSSKSKLFVCRYDPRKMNRIWLYDEEADQYIEVPLRNVSRSSISLWELRRAKSLLKEQYKTAANEELIFKAIDRMREIVEQESAKTKSARRMQQRKRQWDAAPKPPKAITKAVVRMPESVPDSGSCDDFAPFDDIRES